jgi:hypothetical protein
MISLSLTVVRLFSRLCGERIFNEFFIHLNEFFKEFSMNCVDFFLYSGVLEDFLEFLANVRIFNGFLEI